MERKAVIRPEIAGFGFAGLESQPGDEALIALGKRLFFEPELSSSGTVACASCHNVAAGGDDGLALSVGVDGQLGTHNSPTVINSGLNFAQFWDGRVKTLAEQVSGPIHNPVEMNSDWDRVAAVLNADAQYMAAFDALGLEVSETGVTEAIVAYEEALIATGSPFDRWLLGDEAAFPKQAQEGAQLFVQLGCVSCHQGRNLGGNMFQRFGVFENYYAEVGNLDEASLGRFNVTGDDADKHVFKVPSLRMVAETAPYFHDGSIATLDEAVAIMARYQLGRELAPEQTRALVAFLTSLKGQVDEALL